MVSVEGSMTCTEGPGVVEDESWEIEGEKCVKLDDRRIEGFEGKDHVPDGGSVEIGESGSKATWGPVQNRYFNSVGQPAKQTEEEAIVWGEHIGGEVLWCA